MIVMSEGRLLALDAAFRQERISYFDPPPSRLPAYIGVWLWMEVYHDCCSRHMRATPKLDSALDFRSHGNCLYHSYTALSHLNH